MSKHRAIVCLTPSGHRAISHVLFPTLTLNEYPKHRGHALLTWHETFPASFSVILTTVRKKTSSSKHLFILPQNTPRGHRAIHFTTLTLDPKWIPKAQRTCRIKVLTSNKEKSCIRNGLSNTIVDLARELSRVLFRHVNNS